MIRSTRPEGSSSSAMTQVEQADALGLNSSDQVAAAATPGSMAMSVASLITQTTQKKQRSPRAVSSTTPKRMKMYEDDTSSTEYAGGEVEAADDSTSQQQQPRAELATLQAEEQLQQQPAGVHPHAQPHQQQGEDGTVFSPSFHVPRNRRSSLDAHHQAHLHEAAAQELHALHPAHIPVHSLDHHHHYPLPGSAMLHHLMPNGTAHAAVAGALAPAAWAQQQAQQLVSQETAEDEEEGAGPDAHAQPEECVDEARDEAMTSLDDERLGACAHAPDGQPGGGSGSGMQLQPQLHHHQVELRPVVPEAVEHEPAAGAEAVEAEGEEELDYMDFDPLLFIKLLPPLEQVVPKHRKPLLPRKTRLCKQKTLVLDLDETLVHSCLDAQADADFTFPVHFNAQEHVIHVRQRPHLHTFMNRVAELFEVVVFTASQKIYAERLLNIIDPDRKLIKHRIFRESCVVVDGNYLKDLTSLGRDLRTTLIVDNSPQAFGFQVDNGVPIESWYDDPADTELLKLLPFLEELVGVDDVRPAIRNKFRMREMIDRVVC